MAKNTSIEELLSEAFHTYQVYLSCTMALDNYESKLPLLKWPDVAQSAIGYAKAWENKNPLETRENKEIETTRQILKSDLIVALAAPIELIYESTRTRVTDVLEKEPKTYLISREGRHKFPVKYKNHLISAINDMFKTLETMGGVKYPELDKRKPNGSSS